MTYAEHVEAADFLRPANLRTAIVVINAYHLQRVELDLNRRGIFDRYKVICPGVQIKLDLRFEDVLISGETLHEMERGSPATRQWFNDFVLTRMIDEANIVMVP